MLFLPPRSKTAVLGSRGPVFRRVYSTQTCRCFLPRRSSTRHESNLTINMPAANADICRPPKRVRSDMHGTRVVDVMNPACESRDVCLSEEAGRSRRLEFARVKLSGGEAQGWCVRAGLEQQQRDRYWVASICGGFAGQGGVAGHVGACCRGDGSRRRRRFDCQL